MQLIDVHKDSIYNAKLGNDNGRVNAGKCMKDHFRGLATTSLWKPYIGWYEC